MGSSPSCCTPGLGHTVRGAGAGGVGTQAAALLGMPGLGLELGFGSLSHLLILSSQSCKCK